MELYGGDSEARDISVKISCEISVKILLKADYIEGVELMVAFFLFQKTTFH